MEQKVLSNEIERLLTGACSGFSCRFHYRAKNGKQNLIDAKVTPVEYSSGNSKGILVRGREVKELMQLREFYHITNREVEVIQCILIGSANREIAKDLSITERTVKSHITHIYNKLGVYNKIQLMNRLKDYNLIPDQKAERVVLLQRK